MPLSIDERISQLEADFIRIRGVLNTILTWMNKASETDAALHNSIKTIDDEIKAMKIERNFGDTAKPPYSAESYE